jgi:hypothetical protein
MGYQIQPEHLYDSEGLRVTLVPQAGARAGVPTQARGVQLPAAAPLPTVWLPRAPDGCWYRRAEDGRWRVYEAGGSWNDLAEVVTDQLDSRVPKLWTAADYTSLPGLAIAASVGHGVVHVYTEWDADIDYLRDYIEAHKPIGTQVVIKRIGVDP